MDDAVSGLASACGAAGYCCFNPLQECVVFFFFLFRQRPCFMTQSVFARLGIVVRKSRGAMREKEKIYYERERALVFVPTYYMQ